MAIDAKKILVGAPDQSATTGGVNYADTDATMPTDARTALGNDFTPCGYVSEDGVTVTPSTSTANIRDWSRNVVRTLLDEFTGEVTFSFIQTDYDSLVALFGEDAVTKTVASSTHGEQLTIALGAQLAPAKAYAFNMKDGDARVRILLPNAQPTVDGDLTFVANQAINWAVHLDCSADANGKSIYIFTDDGVVSA